VASRLDSFCSCCASSPSKSAGMMAAARTAAAAAVPSPLPPPPPPLLLPGTAPATWPTYLAPNENPPGATGALPENLQNQEGSGGRRRCDGEALHTQRFAKAR